MSQTCSRWATRPRADRSMHPVPAYRLSTHLARCSGRLQTSRRYVGIDSRPSSRDIELFEETLRGQIDFWPRNIPRRVGSNVFVFKTGSGGRRVKRLEKTRAGVRDFHRGALVPRGKGRMTRNRWLPCRIAQYLSSRGMETPWGIPRSPYPGRGSPYVPSGGQR